MFSKTEMFLSDQFLSTCWKCCCFWTPMSWCCPFSPTLTLQSWHRLRYFSLLSTDPFQKFLLPTQPLAGHSVTPTLQSHLCFERNSSGMTWSPWKWNGFFLCHWATGFPGNQKLCGQRAACSAGEPLAVPKSEASWRLQTLPGGVEANCAQVSQTWECKGRGNRVLWLGRDTLCAVLSHPTCVCANGAGTEAFLHCPFESTSARRINALEEVQQWMEQVLCPQVRATCSEATLAERAIKS